MAYEGVHVPYLLQQAARILWIHLLNFVLYIIGVSARSPRGGETGTCLFMLSLCCRALLLLVASTLCGKVEVNAAAKKFGPRPSLSFGIDQFQQQETILVVALRNGPAGEEHLKQWARFAEARGDQQQPPIWIICPERSPIVPLVQDLAPYVQPFVVEDGASWATILRKLRLRVSRRRGVHCVYFQPFCLLTK